MKKYLENISEFTSDMIKRLQKSYSTMPKTISPEQAKALSKHLDRLDLASLKQLTKANIPFVTGLARNKVYKKTGKFEVKEETDQSVALATKEKEIETLKNQLSLMKQKVENEKNKAVKPIPNPQTGEVPLTVGIAHKILNDKEKEEKEKKEREENSKKIRDIAKGKEGEKLESFTRRFLNSLNESDASDKAKAMGLTYMKFGRYGKDGKVTHKSMSGNLTAVGKDEKPIKEPTKKSDEPKKAEPKGDAEVDNNLKSKQIMKDFENDFDLDDETSFDGAIKKANELGLDLADNLEDVVGYIQDVEPDKAAAELQDIKAKLKGKPVRSVELSKQADEAMSALTDQTYANDAKPFVTDLQSTVGILQKMVDADETEGDIGSGMSNTKKGFRPEVIASLKELEIAAMDHAAQLEDETGDEKAKQILADIQTEIAYISDDNADHDNYTKSHKIKSSLESIMDLTKQMSKTSSEVKEAKTMSDRDKRIQRAKDMIKYYDAQKKAALKGKNKDLAKKMLKNDIEETVSIKAYKNAVDPSKKGLMISKSGGMSGTIMIKDKKELKDLETKIAQAKRLYNIKEMKKDDAYAIGMAQAKKSMNDEPPLDKKTITKGHEIAKKILNKEEKRVYVESMAGLKKKSDKSGMPYSILKKVFDRGMAAWKTGHRPGASQQQWAYARVNSFITKSSGTWGGADKDLAKQVKG